MKIKIIGNGYIEINGIWLKSFNIVEQNKTEDVLTLKLQSDKKSNTPDIYFLKTLELISDIELIGNIRLELNKCSKSNINKNLTIRSVKGSSLITCLDTHINTNLTIIASDNFKFNCNKTIFNTLSFKIDDNVKIFEPISEGKVFIESSGYSIVKFYYVDDKNLTINKNGKSQVFYEKITIVN